MKAMSSWDWHLFLALAVSFSAPFVYYLFVPDPRKIFPKLGEILGDASFEAPNGLFADRWSKLSGKFANRAFRIIAIPGGGRGGPNAQTIVRLGCLSASAKSNSVGQSRPLDGDGTLPGIHWVSSLASRSDPFSRLDLSPARQSGPQRSVEELWTGFSLNSASLQRKFAKGRLFIGESEIIWTCYGIRSSAETLKAILTFLACIATEVEKHSATWAQTRKSVRVQDYGQFIFYVIMVFLFAAIIALFAFLFLAGRSN